MLTMLIFFILGLIFGSFLNVVVYRLNLSQSILGRSHCPNCKKKIRWHDNIPVLSFIILSAKCRDCGEKISYKYPLLEVLTGLVFALAGNYFFVFSSPNSWIETAFYLGAFFLLLIVFSYDLSHMEIPMIILWIAMGWIAVFYIFMDWISFNPQGGILSVRIYSGALAGVFAFLIFFALSAGSREKWMGMGDAYLALIVGFIVGWPAIFAALLLSFAIGAAAGVLLIIFGKKTMKSRIPFAPFLVTGTIIAVFLYQALPEIKYLLF